MPRLATNADTLRTYLSGAGSDGGAQTDPDASLGGFRSSTRADGIGARPAGGMANLRVRHVSDACGEGTATIEATANNAGRFQAPGGSFGASEKLGNGDAAVLEDGGDASKYALVERTTADPLSGTMDVELVENLGNVFGFDDVSDSERSNGDSEYRAYFIRNEHPDGLAAENVRVYLATLGTRQQSDDGQLGASGGGEIKTTGNFEDWPDRGFDRIRDNGGNLEEVVYYESRTDKKLTVPDNGRGMLGTSVVDHSGHTADDHDAIPGVAIGKETPSDLHDGSIQSVADEDTEPSGITWGVPITASDGLDFGTLDAQNHVAVWEWRETAAGAKAQPLARKRYRIDFESAA